MPFLIEELIPRGSLSNSRRKNLGITADIAPGKSETLVSVDGSDDAAVVLSITLTKTEKVSFSPGPIIGWPYAVVQWGNAGVSAEMELDFLNGLNFPLPCSSVRVVAINPPDGFGPVKLGAFVTYLPVPRPSLRLKRSFSVGALANGATSSMIHIPPFAGNVVFHRDMTQSFRLKFFDRNENLVYSTTVGFDVQMEPVELAASIAGLKVENTGFAGWTASQVVFGLEI